MREFPLKPGHGAADYLLYVNRTAVGVVEAKKQGETLTGVEVQTEKYSHGLPQSLPAVDRPLPWLYQSTGVETRSLAAPVPRAVEQERVADQAERRLSVIEEIDAAASLRRPGRLRQAVLQRAFGK